jgi:hypothetical protein
MRGRNWGWGLILAGGLGLAQALGAQGMPKGPADFRSDELGLRFQGPEGWYVECHTPSEDGRSWEFSTAHSVVWEHFKDIYPTYDLIWFCKIEEPTPQVNMYLGAYWVKMANGYTAKQYLDDMLALDSRVVENFKLVAGPVKDKIDGHEALTVAADCRSDIGQFSFNSRVASMRAQMSVLSVGGGALVLEAFGDVKEWEQLRPYLRAFRKSVKFTKKD